MELLVFSFGVFGSSLFGEFWFFSDLVMNFGEEFFTAIDFGFFEALIPFRELAHVIFLAFFFEFFHVFIDVDSEDSFSVDLGVVFLSLSVFDVSWESSGGVGNIKSSITGSLEGSKNSGSSGGSNETHVEVSFEWSTLLIHILRHIVIISVGLLSSSIHLLHTQLLQKSSTA